MRFAIPMCLGMFDDTVEAFIDSGGRVKFNLDTLSPADRYMTEWELRRIVKSPKLMNNTDFYLGGKQLQGAELDAALKPYK